MPANLLIPALVGSLLDMVQPAAQPPQPDPAALSVSSGAARPLPALALKGTLTPGDSGAVWIDGKSVPLSVSAQIRNERNLIVQPSSLQQPAKVRYLTDASGAVSRVWILTAAEAAAN
jgi:hypothetical protein